MTTTLCRTPVRASMSARLDGVSLRNRRRDGQKTSDERRADPADPRLGRHREPRFVQSLRILVQDEAPEPVPRKAPATQANPGACSPETGPGLAFNLVNA